MADACPHDVSFHVAWTRTAGLRFLRVCPGVFTEGLDLLEGLFVRIVQNVNVQGEPAVTAPSRRPSPRRDGKSGSLSDGGEEWVRQGLGAFSHGLEARAFLPLKAKDRAPPSSEPGRQNFKHWRTSLPGAPQDALASGTSSL